MSDDGRNDVPAPDPLGSDPLNPDPAPPVNPGSGLLSPPPSKVPPVVDMEPVFREPLDIHPKLIAAELGGGLGIIISALAVHYLEVEMDPAEVTIAVGAVFTLVSGLAGYVRSSKR